MNQFRSQPEFKQQQSIQSFYEPALDLLTKMLERNKANLRSKGYDENNAAITKNEFGEAMARQFRITQWLAQDVVNSLIKSEMLEVFGGYVKPKVEVKS